MKNLKQIFVIFSIFFLAFIQGVGAAPSCISYLNSAQSLISVNVEVKATPIAPIARVNNSPVRPRLNSDQYQEKTNLTAQVTNLQGVQLGSSLKEALNHPDIKLKLSEPYSQYQILLKAKLPLHKGGGELRLVTLNIGSGNRAYNHVELVALLKVNPEMANALGIYRVEGREDVVWVPDMKTLNSRLLTLSEKYGYSDAVWSYGAAEGVVSTLPYLKLLANGKFPFSSDADVNLSVHDSMHAVAFAVLNITKGGREILNIAKTRNQIIVKIYERLEKLEEKSYAQQFLNTYASYLSPDSMERTMLLTIIMTGNYDYFSAHNVRSEGRYYSPQNEGVTTQRIVELLKLYTYSQKTFDSVLNSISPVGEANHDAVRKIFQEEVSVLKAVDESLFNSTAQELIKFIPKTVLTKENAENTEITTGRHASTTAGPETLNTKD